MAPLKDLITKLEGALNELINLKIVTAVGAITGTGKELDIDWTQNPKVMLTKIDMIQGDITTVIDPIFVTGEYKELRQFHAEREKQGLTTVRDNIKAIEELYNLAKNW